MSDTAKTIDTILALMNRADRYMKETRSDVAKQEYEQSLADVTILSTPETLTALVRHYEQRLIEVEAQSMRFAIMKEAIREALKEEQK